MYDVIILCLLMKIRQLNRKTRNYCETTFGGVKVFVLCSLILKCICSTNHPLVMRKYRCSSFATDHTGVWWDECQCLQDFIQPSDEGQDIGPRHPLLREDALQAQRARTKPNTFEH